MITPWGTALRWAAWKLFRIPVVYVYNKDREGLGARWLCLVGVGPNGTPAVRFAGENHFLGGDGYILGQVPGGLFRWRPCWPGPGVPKLELVTPMKAYQPVFNEFLLKDHNPRR
jgi:hypothetical protein